LRDDLKNGRFWRDLLGFFFEKLSITCYHIITSLFLRLTERHTTLWRRSSFQSHIVWTPLAAKSRSARFGMLRRLSTRTTVGRSPRSISLFKVGRDRLRNRMAKSSVTI